MPSHFFGPRDRTLFGVDHPPGEQRIGRPPGVVLCPPFGEEYLRSHRFYRNLASALAERSHHGFRFDYYGTGDAGGVSKDVTFESMATDIGAAVAELRALSGVSHVTLFASRLAATPALRALENCREVSRLVLLDPTIDAGNLNPRWTTSGFTVSEELRAEVLNLNEADFVSAVVRLGDQVTILRSGAGLAVPPAKRIGGAQVLWASDGETAVVMAPDVLQAVVAEVVASNSEAVR